MRLRKKSALKKQNNLRIRLQLTQSECATMLGLSRDVFQNIELGRSTAPQSKAMLKWAELETVFSKPAPRVPEQWYHEDKALADLEKWRVRRRGFLQWKLDESSQALEEMEAVYQDCLQVLGHLSRIAESDPHPVLGRTFEKHIRIKLTKRIKSTSLLHQEKLRLQIAAMQAELKAMG